MLPTNNSYYSSTSNRHRRSHRCLSMGTRQSTRGGRRDPPSRKRDGGASATRSSSPWPSPSPAAPKLAPRPRDPIPGPAATAAALLFIPPALSLVHHPALYLPASILVLLTPARNSASLPAPPPHLPRTATTMPTTSAALTPQWTCHQRTTGRGQPSPRRHRPHPHNGGVEGCRTQRPVAPGITQPLCQVSGTSAKSSLVVIIVGG